MDELSERINKRMRYEDYASDDSNLQSAVSPSSINSQLAPFLIKAETFNNIVGDEDEVPAVQDIQVPSQHQNFSMNVFQLLQKQAIELNDVDLHVLITRCRNPSVVFRRNRDETYANLLFHPGGNEMEADPTNYVECRLCAKIFTRSGGHLKRHRSKHYPEVESMTPSANINFEPPSVSSQNQLPHVFSSIEIAKNFAQNSPNLPVSNLDFSSIKMNEKENLARALTQFCVQEALSPGLIQRRSFVDLVNVILGLNVSRNNQTQLVANVILPPPELITTCIYRRFNWLCHEKIPKIQTDLLIYNGAFTVGCLPSVPKLTALSIHYFDQKWALKKAVIGLAPSDDQSSESLIWNQCIDSVSAVNLQRQTLNPLICLGGVCTAMWSGSISVENRNILCSCDLIEGIVDEIFDLESNSGENDILESLIKPANIIMKYSKFQMFNYAVKVPPDTVYKWLKILRIVEFASEELTQLQSISAKSESKDSLPKEFFDALQSLESHQELLAGLIELLRIFRSAIVELQAIEEPTLPLVWPAIMTLKYDLTSFAESSRFPALNKLTTHALLLIERDFSKLIRDEHRTATFLNPKQRKLQHLMSTEEYETFKNKLRKRLCIIKPKLERKVEDRRRFYEDDDSEEIVDEIDRYLNTKRSGNETIVEFWSRNENLMPKLSAEARRLLACPASSNYVCGNLSHYVSKMTEFSVDAIAKLVITRSLEQI